MCRYEKNEMNMNNEIFLRNSGIKENQSILDFGCGLGNYTILVAVVVG